MIIGIGSDLCDIRRIEKSLARFGERFTTRIFTAAERAICERRANPAASYARRFAAKEACAKALGTGINTGVFWSDMEVVNNERGRPGLLLHGGALVRLQTLLPENCLAFLHLTLTDEPPVAQAFVILEARPLQHIAERPVIG